MNPTRGDLGQRPHDEPSLVSAGMGQHQSGDIKDGAAMGDEIKVERACGVGRLPRSTEGRFDAQQGRHDRPGVHRCLDKHHTVEIGRIGPVRPGMRSPPPRSATYLQSDAAQSLSGGFQQASTCRIVARQV